MRLLTLALLASLASTLFAAPAAALPRNTRQVPEGYWVGGIPSAADIDELHSRGVRVVVSGRAVSPSAHRRMEDLGIDHVDVAFGSTFRHGETILSRTSRYDAGEIFVHCDHGGDRAGAMLAFLLVAREGWAVDHALLAVANPSSTDVGNLTRFLESFGLCVTESEHTTYDSIYSGARMGSSGGLKVRGGYYDNLVRSTLEALQARGAIPESADDCAAETALEEAAPAGLP